LIFFLGFITVKEQCEYCKTNANDPCCKNIRQGACAAAERNPNMLTVTDSASTNMGDDNKEGLNKWIIIGISVGGVFLLIFTGFLVFFYRSVKHSTSALLSSVQSEKGDHMNRGYSCNTDSPSAKTPMYIDTPGSPSVNSPLNGGGDLVSPVPRSATKSYFSDAAYTIDSGRNTYSDQDKTITLGTQAADNEYLVIIAFGESCCAI
jgi:hypothetical protein